MVNLEMSVLINLAAGFVLGVFATMLFNKLRTGSASAAKMKREMEDYQSQVEAHFEETSKKFQAMTEQYKDLYQHLSVSAATLCRPENRTLGLSDEAVNMEGKNLESAKIDKDSKLADKAEKKPIEEKTADNKADKTVELKTAKAEAAAEQQKKKSA